MALDARALAHSAEADRPVSAPARGHLLRLLALVLWLAGPGAADDKGIAELVAPYLRAREQRALGEVTGRAYAESRRPAEAPTPYSSVSVRLLPYSADFAGSLDEIKARLRDSLDAYTRAVARIESARVDYERSLVAAGAGELIRDQVTDAHGLIRMADLPAGDWLLLAWRESGHLSKQFKIREQDARAYPDVPSNVTYSVVTYWRTRVAVRPSEAAEVSLSDRSVWLTAVRQEVGAPVRRHPAQERSPARR